jgi:hypothetical protein
MSAELVKKLRDLGDHAAFEPHMFHYAADRIEGLEREVMRWHGLFDEKHNLMLAEKARAEAAEARLAKAVEAERERCAKVAESFPDSHSGLAFAAAIRGGAD